MRIIKALFILAIVCNVCWETAAQEDYFQQEVNYDIEVELDDQKHEIRGVESFEYINNSPHSLEFIWVHLWPNAYKDNSTALSKQLERLQQSQIEFYPEEKRGCIDSLRFTSRDVELSWSYHPEHIDICKIMLPEPLKSGERIVIETPFRVKIPSGSISRLGHIGQSYQMTQWYPKPAVYDKDGWHPMPYLTQGEFYSEFGSYDVRITLPANYVLGATGDRVNAYEEEEFINEKIAFTEAYLKDPTSSQYDELNKNKFPPSDEQMKTVRFRQSNVHDFAWFADKRYLVLKGEVELPESKRKVDTWALFTPNEADLWAKSLEYLHDATYYYSLWNGEYPYNHVTAVDGTISAGGGMEYPNITVIGTSGTDKALEVVIMHEVGHNWFYGILGSNERIHAWMDEGVNSFTEARYMDTKYPDLSPLNMYLGNLIKENPRGLTYSDGDQLMYYLTAKNYTDQPMQIHSDRYTSLNYGAIVYKKSAFVLRYLMNYLGEDVFNQCMHAYFDRWKFKHPKPEDMRKVFEEVSKKDLSWFFDDVVKTNKQIDYKMGPVRKGVEDNYFFKIKNTGEIKAPFVVSVVRDGELVDEFWVDGIEPGETIDQGVPDRAGDVYMIDYNEVMPESNRQNNRSKASGLVKRVEPVKLKMLTAMDNGKESQVFWLPLYGWNEYNKSMVGLNLSNTTIPFKDFEYSISPMYSFSTNNINGFARFSYYQRKADYHLKFQSFNDANTDLFQQKYLRVNPEVKIRLNPSPRDRKKRTLTLGSNFVNHFLAVESQDENLEDVKSSSYRVINEAKYNFNYQNIRHSYSLELSAKQIIEDWGNFLYPLSFTTEYGLNNRRGRPLFNFRLFGGKFMEYSNTSIYNWSSGGQNGIADYEYDGLYLGRSEFDGFESKQIYANQTALRKWFGVRGNNMATSLVVDYKLPVGLPIYVYGGAAALDWKNDVESTWEIDYAGGLSFDLEFAKVHFPLVYPELFEDEGKIKPWQAISFELYLEQLSPQGLIRDILRNQ